MSVFSTQRPDPHAKMNALLETARRRKRNLKALREEMNANDAVKDMEKSINELDVSDDKFAKEREKKQKKAATEAIHRKLGLLEHRLMTEGKNDIYNMVLFEMTFNSFWLDDPIKEASAPSLYDTFMGVLETLDKLDIKRVSPANESMFIKNTKDKINIITEKACKRIVADAKDTFFQKPDEVDAIDFSLNDVEDDELTNDLADLGKEEIEDLVKQKVLQVVNDERIANQEMQAMLDEIDQSIQDAEAEANEENIPDDREEDTTETPAKESFELRIAKAKRAKFNRSYGSTLFESIMMHNLNQINQGIVAEGIDASQNDKMSATFNSTVYTYTVLEMLNTLDLYTFDRVTAKKLADHYKTVK